MKYIYSSLIAIFLTACTHTDHSTFISKPISSQEIYIAISNATYTHSALEEGEEITLSDGVYNYSRQDGTKRIQATLLPEWTQGDVDSDREDESVVVLAVNTGGSGVFLDLVVIHWENGKPSTMVTLPLGDRHKMRDIEVKEGTIYLYLTVHAETDGLCCPTKEVIYLYRVDKGGIKQVVLE